MQDIIVDATKDSLRVICDSKAGLVELEGISYPQDAADFFNPIYEWLDNYLNQTKRPIRMILRINYVNTSSTKCLYDLFDRMESHFKEGHEAIIIWYYETDDEDIKETGIEFKEDLDLPFDLQPY